MSKNFIRKITADELINTNSVEEMLRYLSAPTWIFLPGKSHQSCRLITTLLHGNEPSGSHAIYRLIKENFRPVVDTWILIASISTALTEPIFSRRVINGNQDINRCFNAPWLTDVELLAEQIIKDITDFKADAVIDIHNTSGDGPGFSVSTSSSESHVKIAGLFSNTLVITNFKLGALMEVDFNCPILTIECGGNKSQLSHSFAYGGIRKYLSITDLSRIKITNDIHYYRHPIRLELKKGYQLTYGTEYQKDSDITLCHSIEEQNFGTTYPNKRLGWLGGNTLKCLQAIDSNGNDLVDLYFENKNGELYTRSPLHLFMVTTNHSIAETDCLFYLTYAAIP